MSRPKTSKQLYIRTINCENCGERKVQHRPGGRFCSPKCRVENWWKRKLGVAKADAPEQGSFGIDSLPEPE